MNLLLRHFRAPILSYEDPQLVDVVFRKTQAYEPTTRLDISPAKTVLDFGGGCGIHYKQKPYTPTKWAVVETPAMITRAKALETDHLQFFTTVAAAHQWLDTIDLIYCNGALQYTRNPLYECTRLASLRAPRMIYHRTVLLSTDGTIRTTQRSWLSSNGPNIHVPLIDRRVYYHRTCIPQSLFLAAHSAYTLTSHSGNSYYFTLKASP